VPDRIDSEAIVGAYVANQVALASFQALNTGLRVEIRGMFF